MNALFFILIWLCSVPVNDIYEKNFSISVIAYSAFGLFEERNET
jgi:hypothetical protein